MRWAAAAPLLAIAAGAGPMPGRLRIVPSAPVAQELERAYRAEAPEQGYCVRAVAALEGADTVLQLLAADSARSVPSVVAGRPGVAFACPGARVTLHTHPPDACWISLSDVAEINREQLDVGLVQCGPTEFRAWVIRLPR